MNNNRRNIPPDPKQVDLTSANVIEVTDDFKVNTVKIFPCKIKYGHREYRINCACAYYYLIISINKDLGVLQHIPATN